MRLRLAAGVTLAVAVLVAFGGRTAVASSSVLFTITDHRVDEASGIARGHTSPGVYYVQNDSGDSARFFAIDARTGRVRAVYRVPGATNHDWEDIAVAPDARGVWSLWLADIGDNHARRDEVQLYRVDEPHVDMSRLDATARTSSPDVWRLRYPGGPVNAESLAVSPRGRAFLVTKSETGRSRVYAVPAHADPNRVQLVTSIGAITLPEHPSIIPARLQVLATGAALSVDGSLFAVRTYTDAYVWRVHADDLAAAIRAAPTRVTLPLQEQGEGVCIVGGALVIDTEGVGAQVLRVSLPGARTPVTAHPSPARSSATAASTASPSPSAAVRPPSAATDHSGAVVGAAIGGVAALAVLAIGGAVWRRRTRG